MPFDSLSIRGARENNLHAVDLDLPLRRLVAFTGVSGSGKSSLAFDTLHQEGQRRYLEALAAHRRASGDALRRPDVDAITGLPPTIALDQRAVAPDRRATVATFAEIHPLLRVVFARAGTQHCPTCDRPIRPVSHEEIVAILMARPEGRLTLQAPVRWSDGSSPVAILDEVARAGFSRVQVGGDIVRVERVTPEALERAGGLRVVVDRIRLGPDRRDRVDDAVRTTARAGGGVIVAVRDDGEQVFVDRPYCWHDDRALPHLEPRLLSFRSPAGRCPTCRGLGLEESGDPCAACGGTRLREEARFVRWGGHTLPELTARTAHALAAESEVWAPEPVTATALAELARRFEVLAALGLDHLELDRSLDRLSAGEYQRLRLAGQVGAGLSGVLYVLDEPTAGLHDAGVAAVVGLLGDLRDAGNTVVVVSHHPGVVAAADEVVDFGPGPGVRGGQIAFHGTWDGLLASGTATGQWMSGQHRLPAQEPREPTGRVALRGIERRNLHGVDVDLPVGVLAALVGPSGAGKTALLAHAFDRVEADPDFTRVIAVRTSSARTSSRSNPATFVGAWDVLRELLAATREARIRGMGPGFFSFNVKGGRCEVCRGTGVQRVDLDFLPDVWLPCEVCEGRRFDSDVLQVRWKGRTAAELLELRADEAHALLAGHPKLEAALRALIDVGLGYVPLGQPGHTLSGGESQRLRLARELARARRSSDNTVYLLDNPTVGLHPADVDMLLRLLRRLVHEGATVWIATHLEAFAAACDWVVRLGPGAGQRGGKVLSSGPPQPVDNSGDT